MKKNFLYRNKNELQSNGLEAINLTSLMDLMCVLLIVFIVSAPIVFNGININLPSLSNGRIDFVENKEYVTISYTKDNLIYIEDSNVNLDNLINTLNVKYKNLLNIQIFIKGDVDVKYGNIMLVMSLLNNSGYNNVTLVGMVKD